MYFQDFPCCGSGQRPVFRSGDGVPMMGKQRAMPSSAVEKSNLAF
jgi:hypothetical protein